jgi:hypothetical protein
MIVRIAAVTQCQAVPFQRRVQCQGSLAPARSKVVVTG